MKILFVVEHFPSFSETFVLNEVTGLIDLGHDVEIYAIGKPSAPVEHPDVKKYNLKSRIIPNQEVPNSKFRRLAGAIKWLPALISKCGFRSLMAINPIRYGKNAANLSLLYSCVPLLLRDTRFDAIHCHFGDKGTLALAWRKMKLVSGPISTVFHAHELCALSDAEGRKIYGPLFLDTLLLPISECWIQRLISWGALPDRTLVHHMGVDLIKYDFKHRTLNPDDTVSILTVARLVEQKGYEFAIRSIAHLRQLTSRKFKYTIIGAGDGAGDLENPLRKLVDEIGVSDIVTFAGPQPQDAVSEYIRAAHIFLLPSVTASNGLQEGIPVALMEAMASGLPVVTTRHSGIPELVEHGHSGMLAEERAIAPLAEAMARLISDRNFTTQISANARAKVEADFDLNKLNRGLEQILNRELALQSGQFR